MLKEFVDRIVELAHGRDIEIEEDHRVFTTKPVYPVEPPEPTTLRISTLQGVVDWLESEGKAQKKALMVHVNSPRHVSVCTWLDEAHREREHLIGAEAKPCGFEFHRMMEIEKFIIEVQTSFVDTDAKKNLIGFVSGIAKNEIRTAQDDGI
jgi:hypothetical protein